jgi:hypothetical protein
MGGGGAGGGGFGGGGEPPGARPGGRPRVSAVGRADRIGSDPARLGPCAAQPSDADPRSDRTLPRPPMLSSGARSDRECQPVAQLPPSEPAARRERESRERRARRALPHGSREGRTDPARSGPRSQDPPSARSRARRLARRSSARPCHAWPVPRRALQTLQRARSTPAEVPLR